MRCFNVTYGAVWSCLLSSSFVFYEYHSRATIQQASNNPQDWHSRMVEGKTAISYVAKYLFYMLATQVTVRSGPKKDNNQPDFGHRHVAFLWNLMFNHGVAPCRSFAEVYWRWFLNQHGLEWRRFEKQWGSRTQMVTKFQLEFQHGVWRWVFLTCIDASVTFIHFTMHQSTHWILTVSAIYDLYIEWTWIVHEWSC